ncbi:hypothetical protein H072_1635 [Dactylellina haptotyla CBS 200.50]|uniref:Lysine-specific metallo-endopeptidase domain-containing protein n=1 Tax=Dactylellina haptotyla (strain CBS 200.50) TaxID=1284197 RepID=S8ANF9_DACHA|nr:hypothetical protein H072_1635 [Dactylellina haptotyla CBS 200.50]
MLFAKAIFVALLAAVGTEAALNKQLAYPNGLHDPFDPGFTKYTKVAPYKLKKWTNGLIPQGCKDRLVELKLDLKKAEVYDVTYNTGCKQPWVFCRAGNAQLDIKTMANLFGRLPLHMRALVRHPIAVPQSSCSALAYTDRGDIVMKGNCNTPSVWIHETGHQMDAMLKPASAESRSTAWKNAIKADSCVPDSYANVNEVEDFAQNTVVALFKSIRGSIPKPSKAGCFNNQLNRVLNKYKTRYLTYGGVCNGKVPPSKPVNKNAKEVNKLAVLETGTVVGECHFNTTLDQEIV